MKHKTVNTRADRVGQVRIAFAHKPLTAWAGACWMVAKFLERIRFRHCVLVTNDTQLSAEEIWRTYRPRANEENCIKELQEGYGWHEFNVRSFCWTEAAMLVIGMVCYNLVHHLNRCALETAGAGLARLKTLRLKVLAIPAIYGRGGRVPTLRLGVAEGRLRAKMRYWLERIERLGLRLLNCNAVGRLSAVEA